MLSAKLPAATIACVWYDDGKVVKGSEKTKVFAPRRQGVGYEIVPEQTSSFASDDSTGDIQHGKRTSI